MGSRELRPLVGQTSASVVQGGNPHGPTVVPSCVSTCGFYFREFFSIINGATFNVPNPPRAGAGCASSPQHSKDGASVLRVTPSLKIFICSLHKCICTYTGLWAFGWAVYFVNISADPVTESVRVLTSTSTSDQYCLHFINKWISLHCNVELGWFCLFSWKTIAFIFSHCLPGFTREQFYYKYIWALYIKRGARFRFLKIETFHCYFLKGHLWLFLFLFTFGYVYK